jgi:hypothetical protein
MPRKAAAPAELVDEPRRSTRIKDQPKPAAPVSEKAPAKPKAKKADKDDEGTTEEKPKSTKGRKRKADEANGDDAEKDETEKPASKKVSTPFSFI